MSGGPALLARFEGNGGGAALASLSIAAALLSVALRMGPCGGVGKTPSVHLRASSWPRARLLSSGTCHERGPAGCIVSAVEGGSTSSASRIHCFVRSRLSNRSARKLQERDVTLFGGGIIVTNLKWSNNVDLSRILFLFYFFSDLDRNGYTYIDTDANVIYQMLEMLIKNLQSKYK